MNLDSNDLDSESRETSVVAEPGLAKAAAGGVAWVGLSYLITRVVLLISTVVLARALSPDDFGVYAIALAFITYAEVVNDLGVAQALVLLPSDKSRNDAALVVCLLVSSLLIGIAMPTAPFVARFFGHPEVGSILRALSLSLFLRAIGQVPDALLLKDLRFRERFRANAWRAVVQGLVWIVLAIAGVGVWALVYGYLAGYLVNSWILWTLVKYRPNPFFWRITRSTVQPLLSFAAPLVGNMLLLSLVNDIDYLIVGRRLGTTALGYYTVAFRIPQMLISNSFQVFAQVLVPVLVRASPDPERLRRGYLNSTRIQVILGMSVAVCLAVVAPMLVPVVFGSRWARAIVPLQVLSVYAVLRSLAKSATDVFKGMGRPGLAFWSSFAWLVALVPSLLIATRFGINGVSWAQLLVALLAALALHAVAIRTTALPLRSLGRRLGPAFLAAAGTALGAGIIRLWLPGPESVRLAAALIVGLGLGLALLHAADRQFLPEMRRLASSVRGNPEPGQVDVGVEETI